MSFSENLNIVKKQISDAISASEYNNNEVLLVAVSKTHTANEVKNAYDCGVRDFGENRVQELLEKHEVLPDDIKWHMIGHLQTNKVKYIAPFIHMIHSVDSLKLCKEIEKEAAKCDRVIPILLEVNISNEESKYGLMASDVPELLNQIKDFKHIKVNGLMTVAPFTDDIDEVKEVFKNLRQLFLDISDKKLDNVDMNVLSMGMSNDFFYAIEEGSNCVRIGSSLFGTRNYD